MKISVVIPTKNDESVFDAITSVLEQEHGDYEVVVVDGSEGGHRQELEEFCSHGEKVRYFHEDEREEPIKGLNGARNFGVENAEGEGITLLDADCVATPGWLEAVAETLEEDDVVECKVTYEGGEKNCPMDRVVQNEGTEYGFLGAGLSFRREVWEEERFDERFHQLRNDTAFGLDALENGFSYGFCADAEVLHRAGRFSPLQFVKERLRFVYEPLFFNEYSGHNHFDDSVDHLSRVLYPRELVYLALLAAAFFVPMNHVAVPLAVLLGEAVYLRRENRKRELDLCPKDLLLLFFLVPLALIAKRMAIWKGAMKYNVSVV